MPCIWLAFALTATAAKVLPAAETPDKWPALPQTDSRVVLPAQEWPLRPGPRTIEALIHYPGGKLSQVGPETGLMLTLHNWGGVDCVGTAHPQTLANRLNVVAICVNYLQSGKRDSIDGPEPYDFGYLQALDALRALHWAYAGLQSAETPFAADRLFATGGSGGGNVTLMANKLAPRTFACVVDMCGMKKLSDDIAYGLPGGSGLNARYRRNPADRNYLSRDGQELRCLAHPQHLQTMASLPASAKIVTVHGVDDTTCPFADAKEFAAAAQKAGLDVEPHFIAKQDLDGRVFSSTGHALGNRTEIVFRVAGEYLAPAGPKALRRKGPSDFDRREEVRYRTHGGQFVISYADGFPIGRFEPASEPPAYDDHLDPMCYIDAAGHKQPIRSIEDWQHRRGHILASFQQVAGDLPGPLQRPPLDVRVTEETRLGSLTRRKLNYQSDWDDRVTAWLFLPERDKAPERETQKLPAVLCLHQTTSAGKNEPAGLTGDSNLHYALELAQRGYATLAPDYPSFGEHAYDFNAEHGYASGTMKAVWDNMRAIDLLETLSEVDASRIGCIGHSLGGHNAIFTAAFDPRIKATVSNCGFCTFQKDDVPSWTGPRYMPRIATVYGNDARRVPFDFPELIGLLAPRPFLACAAEGDSDFDLAGVKQCVEAARSAYDLYKQPAALVAFYYPGPHAFPQQARQRAYEFLDRHLKAAKK